MGDYLHSVTSKDQIYGMQAQSTCRIDAPGNKRSIEYKIQFGEK